MSGDILKRLAEAGTPLDLVMEVAETLAEARAAERLLERRRAKDRERKRAHSTDSAETVEIAENAETTEKPPAALDKEKPPTPPKEIKPTTPDTTGLAARKADPFPRPEWADRQVWSDLLANRRKKNLANTASAHRKLMADIEKLADDDWPPGRILEAAVSRGWGAIYPGCKDDENGGRQTNQRSMGGPRTDPTLALVRSAIHAQS